MRQEPEPYGLEGEVVEVVEYIGIPDPLEHGGKPGYRTRTLPEGEERLGATDLRTHLHGPERLIGRHDASFLHRGPETAVSAVVCADCRQREECVL